MPQALPAIGAFFVKVFTAKAIGYVIARTILVNFALAAVSKMLAGRQSRGRSDIAQTVMVRSSIAPREIVYGQVKKSGVVIWQTTTGDKNKYMWFVLAIAGHQLQEMTDVWFDSELIAAADINGSTGAVEGSGRYAGKAWIFKKLGTAAQTALTQLDSESQGWSSNHRGEGVAALFIKLERDPDVFPSGPPSEFFVLCKGKRLYDPRLDSTNGGSGSHRLADATTWAWSDNSALCSADYMLGGSLYFDTATPDPRLGMGIKSAQINWPVAAASANESDENVSIPGSTTQKRYTCNGVLSAGDDHETNMDKILATMAQEKIPPYVAGKYRILAGKFDAPTHTLTDADLYGGWELVGGAGLKESANAICGIYHDAARDWGENPSRVRTNAAYESEDGGQILRNIALDMVTDEYRAQRLAEIALRRTRDQATARFFCGASTLPIAPWETKNVALAEMPAWMAGKTWRALAIELELKLPPRIVFTSKVESESVFTDLNPATDFLDPNTGVSVPIHEEPDEVESLAGLGDVDSVILSWPFPSPWFPQWRIQLYEHTSATPFASAVKVWEGVATGTRVARTTAGDRFYWVRIKGLRGEFSATTPPSSGLAVAPTSITAGFHIKADRQSHNKFLIGSGSGTTNQTTTITPINAAGAVTYAWTRISADPPGSTKITATAPTGQTTGFQAAGLADTDVEAAEFEVEADDTVDTDTLIVLVRFERDDNFGS